MEWIDFISAKDGVQYKIKIPSKCCGIDIEKSYFTFTHLNLTVNMFNEHCPHHMDSYEKLTEMYDTVWKLQIAGLAPFSKQDDKEGFSCSGHCGNWFEYARANQSNGTFICRGCQKW